MIGYKTSGILFILFLLVGIGYAYIGNPSSAAFCIFSSVAWLAGSLITYRSNCNGKKKNH